MIPQQHGHILFTDLTSVNSRRFLGISNLLIGFCLLKKLLKPVYAGYLMTMVGKKSRFGVIYNEARLRGSKRWCMHPDSFLHKPAGKCLESQQPRALLQKEDLSLGVAGQTHSLET